MSESPFQFHIQGRAAETIPRQAADVLAKELKVHSSPSSPNRMAQEDKIASATAAFLNVPWELLADANGFLAAHRHVKYSPLRRLGSAGETAPPSDYHLSLLFMAAEPHGGALLQMAGARRDLFDGAPLSHSRNQLPDHATDHR
ncbi:hypothetical protein EH222_01955, partial [candidate division KSB1 bacterium]